MNALPSGSQPACSVMIPTHNPKMDSLGKVLDALRAQTLPLEQWELIVIDNGSEPPLAARLDLSWHPRARCLTEDRRGVFHARQRGLRECAGKIVVGVDDDNVLEPNYLAEAFRIGEEWPALGVWGGQIKPSWEEPPSADVLPWIQHLALCEFDAPAWASFVHDWTVPYGAGMCMRAEVVQEFLEKSSAKVYATRFGRNGRSMVSGEDHLLAYTATAKGWGVGKFPSLVLHHLISKQRVQPDYLVKTAQGNSEAALLLQLMYQTMEPRFSSRIWPCFKVCAGFLFLRGMRRRMVWAEAFGQLSALSQMKSVRRDLDETNALHPAGVN